MSDIFQIGKRVGADGFFRLLHVEAGDFDVVHVFFIDEAVVLEFLQKIAIFQSCVLTGITGRQETAVDRYP